MYTLGYYKIYTNLGNIIKYRSETQLCDSIKRIEYFKIALLSLKTFLQKNLKFMSYSTISMIYKDLIFHMRLTAISNAITLHSATRWHCLLPRLDFVD